jgi:FKBP-type peptidyl-prolyl cis-trans isomerase SlyD
MKQQRITSWMVFGALLGALVGTVAIQDKAQGQATTVTSGTQVAIEYTLKLDDQAVLETNVGSTPFTYVQGAHRIVPGLEKALEGMKIGESKQVTVQPEEGYGTVDKEAFLEVAKDKLPQDAQTVGAQLQGQNASGQSVHARVAEVKDHTVVVDLNHPLAGKTLYFDIKVLSIQQAPGQ